MKATKHLMTVQGSEIAVTQTDHGDFISITDLAKRFGGEKLVANWMRTKSTIEFLGVWEQLYNPKFKYLEFEAFKNAAGSNKFILSVKQWVSKTNAIGLVTKGGGHGVETFAHEEIALEFAAWLSPEFRLYVVKEFKRLKENEGRESGADWNIRRVLAKANYRIHTDAIKETIIPVLGLPKDREWIVYADEADLLNYVVFGMTAKEWKERNPSAPRRQNIRDDATIMQLTVLSNMESLNGILIRDGMTKTDRFYKLSHEAKQHFESLRGSAIAALSDKTLFDGKPQKSVVPRLTIPAAQNASSKLAELKQSIANTPEPKKPSGR
jgi:hypothetical protein